MSGLSEAELHVQAMRLVCEALQDREQDGLEVDWDVIRQMHDQMDAMLQDLGHKHRYDSSEIVDLRKDRDHWKQARQDAHEAGELMRAEIETLRKELAEQQAETVDVRRQRNNETDRLNATNAVSVQQRDEIAYLRARLDEERSVSAGLRDKLAEAQQPDVGAMRAFVGKVRACVWACYEWPKSWHKIEAALVELDAGTEPTPETEAEGGA